MTLLRSPDWRSFRRLKWTAARGGFDPTGVAHKSRYHFSCPDACVRYIATLSAGITRPTNARRHECKRSGRCQACLNVASLSLARTKVVDLWPLAEIKTLDSLDLTGVAVTDDQVAELQLHLPNCKIKRGESDDSSSEP